MQIDSKIKSICKEKGIRLIDLADKLGVAQPTLSLTIKGNPCLSTLESIAKALDVPVRSLFDDCGVFGKIISNDKVYYINCIDELKNVYDELNTKNTDK